jgi:hypothetical protein
VVDEVCQSSNRPSAGLVQGQAQTVVLETNSEVPEGGKIAVEAEVDIVAVDADNRKAPSSPSVRDEQVLHKFRGSALVVLAKTTAGR